MAPSMEGKVALVTGGASGIGRACALAFAREGADVVVADIQIAGAKETVAMINSLGQNALALETDVTKAGHLDRMVCETMNHFGRLDAAVNNVGHPGYFKDAVETTDEEWDHVSNIDAKSIWLSMKHEIPAMLAGGGGAIVNTATSAILSVVPRMAAFLAFKHAIVGMTKSVAMDFAARDIRANVLCPGPTETKMMLDSFSNLGVDRAAVSDRIPMKRMGRPEEQAEAAVWLCSPRASFVTGIVLPVDGGYSL